MPQSPTVPAAQAGAARPENPGPAPGAGPGALVVRARVARDAVAPSAARADRERRLAPDAIRAITAAGFPRHFVPLRFGGAAGGFTDFADAVAEVSRGCASAGWCASLYASHARLAAYLPATGQEEVWGAGPDARVSAGFVPGGTARADGGDWVLNGSWNYVSGIDFADWALLCAREPDPEPGGLRFFAVPRRDWAVEDTWFTVGLRGTGSRTVVLREVRVPRHRSVAQSVLLAGTAPDTAPAACHGAPLRLVNGLTMLAPALGASAAALDAWVEWIADRTEMIMGRAVRAAEKASVQSTLARVSAAVDFAGLLVHRVAARADGVPSADGTSAADRTTTDSPVVDGMVARSHRDFSVAAEALAEAVERLQRESGTRGQMTGHPVERAWRDVHAATSHAALRFEGNAAVYARHVLEAHRGEVSRG